MLKGTLQMNLPPEVPGHASLPGVQALKYELSLFLVMYIFKARGMKMQTEIGLMDSKDNKEHTGSLELPSSSG